MRVSIVTMSVTTIGMYMSILVLMCVTLLTSARGKEHRGTQTSKSR